MSKPKKSSCLGLFFKSFILSSLVLINLCALGVMVAIKFFQADPAVWMDFSQISSYPWMLILSSLGISFLLAFVIGGLGAAVSAVFGKEGGAKKKAPAPRPQSSRRTTV